MLINKHRCPVDTLDIGFGQNLRRSTARKNRGTLHSIRIVALREEHDSLTECRSEVEVVRNRDDCEIVLCVLLAKDLKDLELMRDVQVRIRLVEEENLRLLAQCPGDENPLTLTPGKGGDRFLRNMLNVRQAHHLQGDVKVKLTFEPRSSDVRGTPHQDNLENREREHPQCILRNVCDQARNFLSAVLLESATFQRNRTSLRQQDTIQ